MITSNPSDLLYEPTLVNTGDLPVKSVSCGAWHAAAITGHDPGKISQGKLVAVNRPTSTVPQSCGKSCNLLSSPHFCESVPHFWLHFEKNIWIFFRILCANYVLNNGSDTYRPSSYRIIRGKTTELYRFMDQWAISALRMHVNRPLPRTGSIR